MLLGAIGRSGVVKIKSDNPFNPAMSYQSDDFFCGLILKKDSEHIFWQVPQKSGVVMLYGKIFAMAGARESSISGEELWQRYQQAGPEFLHDLNGDFILVIRDEKNNKTLLARDKIGAGLLYYSSNDKELVFGSDLKTLAKYSGKNLNNTAIMKYLMFNYNPDQESIYAKVFKLRPAHYLENYKNKDRLKQYWRLNFDPRTSISEEQTGAEIRQHLDSAVGLRVDSTAKTGVFLSGGLDSSTMVSLLHAAGKQNLYTFSFRCKGEGFDESPFARKVADTFGTDHHLIEYGPEEVLHAEEMAGLMEEPFCDVGINVATYLLSKKAAGKVDEIFTGDGGDELFAGHPVYTADKAARLIDWIPPFLLAPFFALGRQLKDSDKKKDLRVKIKRFSESFSYPKTLGTHRWRVYYQPSQLTGLINPDFLRGAVIDNNLFADLIGFNVESNEKDPLARSLYSDYQTAVQFYLRRLDMAKSMGVRPRFPLLDPDISEYCAGIPSRLKLPGMSDVKHIEKIAVDPLLPHEVVHRKDKLGHSIPLKNWMRDNPVVINFMQDVLSGGALEKRGIFNTQAVEKMIREHRDNLMNNSHRLWALMILELWMQKNLDDC